MRRWRMPVTGKTADREEVNTMPQSDPNRTVYARTSTPPAHRDAPKTVVVQRTGASTTTSTTE